MIRFGADCGAWQCRFATVAVVAGLLSLPGCGGNKTPALKMASVKGVVLFREKPLAKARVTFYAKGAPTPVMGDTNDAGEFELKGGAVVGENKVTVVSLGAASGSSYMPDPSKVGTPEVAPLSAERPKQDGGGVELPKLYGDAINTPLNWTVKPEGDLSVKLELK